MAHIRGTLDSVLWLLVKVMKTGQQFFFLKKFPECSCRIVLRFFLEYNTALPPQLWGWARS
jgi:hypothetical protein